MNKGEERIICKGTGKVIEGNFKSEGSNSRERNLVPFHNNALLILSWQRSLANASAETSQQHYTTDIVLAGLSYSLRWKSPSMEHFNTLRTKEEGNHWIKCGTPFIGALDICSGKFLDIWKECVVDEGECFGRRQNNSFLTIIQPTNAQNCIRFKYCYTNH